MKIRAFALCLLICLATCLQSRGFANETVEEDLFAPPSLTIGSPAPALAIEHWMLHDDDGRQPVTEFEPDTVYVLDFWGTYCAPCLLVMPHLAELQSKYGDRVVIIGVSHESPQKVGALLPKPLARDDARTYADLARVYRLAADPDSSTEKDYLQPLRVASLPFSVIVGKDGRIAWAGTNSDEMADALAAIVNDTWDRDAFAKIHARNMLGSQVRYLYTGLMRRGEVSKADRRRVIEIYQEILATPPSERPANWRYVEIETNGYLFDLLSCSVEDRAELEEVVARALESASDNPRASVVYATTLVDLAQRRGRDEAISPALVEESLRAAEKVLHSGADTETPNRLKFQLDYQLAHQYGHAGHLEDKVRLLEGMVARYEAEENAVKRNFTLDYLREDLREAREALRESGAESP